MSRVCPFCGSSEANPAYHDADCYIRIYAEIAEDYYRRGERHKFDRHDEDELKRAWEKRFRFTVEHSRAAISLQEVREAYPRRRSASQTPKHSRAESRLFRWSDHRTAL